MVTWYLVHTKYRRCLLYAWDFYVRALFPTAHLAPSRKIIAYYFSYTVGL